MKRIAILTVAVLVVGVWVVVRAQSGPSLQGVWRVTEVVTTGPNAATNSSPQPGLYLFTGRHYAILNVTGTRPATQPADTAKATAAELLAVWGPFVANAGTYEVSGGTVTFRRIVAKNPAIMASTSFATNGFKVDGKTLTVTTMRTDAGPVANPTTTRLTRIE
jgi:hypothetical protein